MPPHMTDARSNPNDQIAHAAAVLKRSAKLRLMFEKICKGGAKPKTVAQLMSKTGLGQVQVAQLAGKLADQQLISKTKIGKLVAYEKDRFYATNRGKIISLATNTAKLKAYPTKYSKPAASGPLRIIVKGVKVQITQVYLNDFDQFSGAKKIKNPPLRKISEKAFKEGVKKLLGEKGTFTDWGGERNDLFTTNSYVKGARRTVAFAFKGPGMKGVLTPRKLGKNGDQIQRLFLSPADVFIVQHHDGIDQSVIEQMEAFATLQSVGRSKRIFYGVMDGTDSARLIAAYPKKFGIKT